MLTPPSHNASISHTAGATRSAAPKRPPRAKLIKRRLDGSIPSRAAGPLRALPPLPNETLQADQFCATDMSSGFASTAPEVLQSPETYRRLALQQFNEFRCLPADLWQQLATQALMQPSNPHTFTARQITPNWSEKAVKHFLNEPEFKRWSLAPQAVERLTELAHPTGRPIYPLPVEQQIPMLETNAQFGVLAQPTTEARFKKLRDTYGSSFAFHGSPEHNWHQILTQGLEPKSGTALQDNGAAYGHGLYVATKSLLSEAFMSRAGKRVLAVVEVIDHPSVKKARDSKIIPTKVFAAIRFIAVYERATVPDIKAESIDAYLSARSAASRESL